MKDSRGENGRVAEGGGLENLLLDAGVCARCLCDPHSLPEALAARNDLENVTVYHVHAAGPAPHTVLDKQNRFRAVSVFTGGALREAVQSGRDDFMPIFCRTSPVC